MKCFSDMFQLINIDISNRVAICHSELLNETRSE